MQISAWHLYIFILGFIALSSCNDHVHDDFNATSFTEEIVQWVKDGIKSSNLRRMISNLSLPDELQRMDWTTLRIAQATSLCMICKSLTKTILTLRQSGTPPQVISSTIANLCTYLNLQTEQVCYGVVSINTPIILYIVDNDPSITPEDVCSLVLQNQGCCMPTPRYQWSIDVDKGPIKAIQVPSTQRSLRILQITDIHYDPLYEPGGNAACREPTCCRRGQNLTAGNSKVAGYWGDFNNCDVPWHAVVEALHHVKSQQKNLDLIYFTGDIIDHGVWETSRQGNTEGLIKIFKRIKETFGNSPIYPILGNHEPHPLNVFAPSNVQDESLSTDWLYKLLADLWISAGWLPESTRETILRGGFYSVSPRKGFRIIAINNNVCYLYNWWLVYQPQDPYGQLQWLADTLLEAENNREFVHILAHIPPGASQCQQTWSREFTKIIHRFSHIIVAHFNGHTHNDEFNVFYDSSNTKILNVAWNGGSITPYSNLNPNYKIYQANENTYEVEEVETWIYNLTEANLSPNASPNWFKLYSFRHEYGLDDLSSSSLNKLITSMAKGAQSTLESYHRNFFKHAEPELEKYCDTHCLREYICRIVSSTSNDETACRYFTTLA